MDYRKKFNQTFTEMIRDLVTVFPQDGEFKMYQLAIRAALMADDDMVRKIVHEQIVEPFGEQLLKRDEAFFLSQDYTVLVEGDSTAIQIVDKLKSCWKSLDAENQAAMWRYFQVLILLDRKIMGI